MSNSEWAILSHEQLKSNGIFSKKNFDKNPTIVFELFAFPAGKISIPFLVRGYFHSFFWKSPFLHGFCSSEKAKKGHSRISEEKTITKISDFVLFIWVIFLQKREIFAYFIPGFLYFILQIYSANYAETYTSMIYQL